MWADAHLGDVVHSYIIMTCVIGAQDPPDMKAVTRAAKVGNFMLKIIIKFCDEYSGFLGSCHQELFQMLLTLHRYVALIHEYWYATVVDFMLD